MVSKGPIILGIGAAIAAAGLLFRNKAAPEEEIPEGEIPEEAVPEEEGRVEIHIKNPPLGNFFQLSITDEQVIYPSSFPAFHGEDSSKNVPVNQPAIFTKIPENWTPPFYLDMILFESLTAHGTIKKIQSWYQGIPDGSFVNVAIPSYGSFVLDLAKIQGGLILNE